MKNREATPSGSRRGPSRLPGGLRPHASRPGAASVYALPLGVVLSWAALSGCAYSTSTALLPPHLKTIAIPVFENATTEYTLEQQITDAVIQRFVADNNMKVVDQRSGNAAIQGKITEYRNSVFGISSVDRAEEYRVTICVSVVFKDLVKNREIWSDENICKTANYYVTPVPGDSAKTELDGRRLAIVRIADEILSRTVESW